MASREKFLFTSESVTEGHPDKIADQISDAILDACLAEDPHSRVACETLTATGLVVIAGEITTTAWVDIPVIVRQTVKEIGYTESATGFDGNDHLFLSDVAAASASLNYTANADGSGGVLTISDGTHAANIALQGQYDDAEFQFAASTTGGTTVSIVPHNDHVM